MDTHTGTHMQTHSLTQIHLPSLNAFNPSSIDVMLQKGCEEFYVTSYFYAKFLQYSTCSYTDDVADLTEATSNASAV